MITEPNNPGGKATLDDILTYLADKAGPKYMGVLMLAIDQQISRCKKTNYKATFLDYEKHITKQNFLRRLKSKDQYEQTFLFKGIPIVLVKFKSSNFEIIKLKINLT